MAFVFLSLHLKFGASKWRAPLPISPLRYVRLFYRGKGQNFLPMLACRLSMSEYVYSPPCHLTLGCCTPSILLSIAPAVYFPRFGLGRPPCIFFGDPIDPNRQETNDKRTYLLQYISMLVLIVVARTGDAYLNLKFPFCTLLDT